MADTFRSFAELLSARDLPLPDLPAAEPDAGEPHFTCAHDADALRESRLFRARVEDLVERRAAQLLEEIAEIVLARELELAPPAIERIVRRTLLRFAAEEPVRVRVNGEDLEIASNAGIPAVTDPQLRRGDAIVEVREGEIDLSLASRLQSVICAWQP